MRPHKDASDSSVSFTYQSQCRDDVWAWSTISRSIWDLNETSLRRHMPGGVLIKVKLINDNAPLTYVYPNTVKTYLTPNHLLFSRQLLCYSNTTSPVIRNLTVFSRTTDKINRINNHFCHRWRHEYVLNVGETQRASKLNINSKNSSWKCAPTLLEICHSNNGIT